MKCNSSKGLLKRFIPFFLTFAAGLLIASIFVPVAAPKFQWGEGRRHQHKEYDRQREAEIKQLREKVARQEEVIRDLKEASTNWHDDGFVGHDAVPTLRPVPPRAVDAPPAPPAAPKAPAAPRR